MKSTALPITPPMNMEQQLREMNEALVPLDSVLCTEELNRRPSRPPDYETENRALVSLAQALADSPGTILQTLADTILKVFQCDSAGVSLVTEDEKRFHWPAIAGVWEPHIGGGTPRDFGPCGDVLDRNAPLLFKHFERRYTYFLPVTPPVEECLLVPFYVGGKAVGTIWAIAHDDRRKFDAEDLRMLVSLGTFASAAHQTEEQLHTLKKQTDKRQESQQGLREMNESLLVSSVRQHELTEQAQRAEEVMRESEQRFRQVADTMPQIVWTARPDGYIDYYNERWYEYTGFPHDEFGQSSWERILHPDDVERCVGAYFGCIREGQPYQIEYRFKDRENGGYRWFMGRTLPIRNERGEITRWFGTCTDIDDQKQANIAANEANLAKDMFLATLSHEIRTPLSAILGWTSILSYGKEAGYDEAELDEGLDVIERNARSMVQLIDDVLDVSRIVSGKLRLEIRPCDLSAVIRAGIDVVRSAAEAKDIRLTAQLDPAASGASCDAARMQQVVWNLLSNAIKFTPKGGTVRITLAREQSDVRIQVSDSGQGIGPDLLPYVFDRFRQADSSTRRHFGGLGLGLSIVKHLVELHGGTVQAQSTGEGHGSMFTVSLPIRAVRTDESSDERATDESEQSATTGLPLVRLDGLRVLVVDDEHDARRLLVKVLQQAGAVVTAAASAAEAIEALVKANPEVLVSDLGMPDQDGFDLIRQVRGSGLRAKDLPAVALTAFVHKNDRRKALLAGFQIHVPKPVDPHDLTAVIASLAGRTGPAA